MSINAYEAYKTVTTTTADPITLTTMLYDGAVKAIRKAKVHHESANRAGFTRETERAYLIIGELLATLDLEQGEIAQRLSGIYTYCMRRIVESSLGDVSKLDEVEYHLTQISSAWKQATAELRMASASSGSRDAAA